MQDDCFVVQKLMSGLHYMPVLCREGMANALSGCLFAMMSHKCFSYATVTKLQSMNLAEKLLRRLLQGSPRQAQQNSCC